MHEKSLKAFKELCNKKITNIMRITLSKLKNRYLQEINNLPADLSPDNFLSIENNLTKKEVWNNITIDEEMPIDLYTCMNNKITNIFELDLKNFTEKNQQMLSEIQTIIKKYKK